MRKIKQAVSLILVFCIGIYLYPAKKSSAMETIGFNDQEYWSQRMEDVRVEGIFDFNEEAITAIENYVVADEKGLFYVEDEASLRLVLTDNEYDLVLKQIEIINKEVASEPIRAALGTEGNPYILTEGTPLPVSVSGAAKTWLKISNIRGATEFTVTANRQVTVTIYRKNLIGKTQVSIGNVGLWLM
ncbi:MAG: hypothetical protein IKZ82_07570 [Clostridia bacterium]|nr:hypothetical protein [Clostridia bacterium]